MIKIWLFYSLGGQKAHPSGGEGGARGGASPGGDPRHEGGGAEGERRCQGQHIQLSCCYFAGIHSVQA